MQQPRSKREGTVVASRLRMEMSYLAQQVPAWSETQKVPAWTRSTQTRTVSARYGQDRLQLIAVVSNKWGFIDMQSHSALDQDESISEAEGFASAPRLQDFDGYGGNSLYKSDDNGQYEHEALSDASKIHTPVRDPSRSIGG